MRKIPLALLLGVSSGALSVTPAMAQSAEADAGGIQEIIVTAQKREESAQKAAIAISVVSAESLTQAGITSPTDLGKVVPAVKISTAASPYVPINIRGIANFALNAYSDPAAVVSYAGVPLSRPSGLFGNLYDLARVEVLKGPQGTLYGRNATAGALNILPAQPKLGEFGGNALLEYGNFDMIHASGAINVPLGEQAALRVAGDFIDRDGYYADGTSDQKSRSMRAQLRVEPSDRFTVTLGADYSHQGGRGPGMSLLHGSFVAGTYSLHNPGAVVDPLVGQFVGDPWDGLNSAASCPTHAAYYEDNLAICKNDSYQDSDFWGVNATIDWDVGFGSLTVLPAFRRSTLDYHVNNYPNLQEKQTHEQSSLEVRLSSNASSSLKWVLGGFVFDESVNSNFKIRLNPAGGPTTQVVDSGGTSYAAFGQVTVPLTDAFRATGGLRYTSDKKTFSGVQNGFPPVAPQLNRQRTDSKLTWKAGVEYDVAPQSLLYAGVDRGYHSGGFFFTGAARDSYEPETITAYTIGSKNMFFNRRLQVNLEGFYYDYKDQQVSHFAVLPSGPGFVTDNAGNAKIKGVEADLRWLATDTTSLFANIQYLNAKYKKFQYSTGFAEQTTGCPQLGVVAGQHIYNCGGYPMINAPKLSINAGVEQTFELASGASVVANVGGQYQSSVWLAPFDYLPFHKQGSKFTADASLTYNAPNGKWSIAGWVRNLTDETVSDFVTGTGDQAVNPNPAAFGNPTPGSVPVAVLRPPRTFGIRVTGNF